ncbi:MAG: alpha-ketoacid dehydrogenase subunit beta [Dehalococcoidia bacterium]|nr:MAG: alpha-ketoacid dehydrogenase subunit beta [Dehalococcoidia bacterium]
MREITFAQAITEALDEEMARDPSVFIMGEDVGVYGGILGQLAGLFDKYGPDRVRDTPISETAIVGAAVGAAATGMRPVPEIMFCDFLGVPMDEILNQLTKMRYMFGGKAKLPIVIRTLIGAGIGAAAQHSQCLEALFMHIPGIKVVIPSTPYDAKGLLKSAIRDDSPVIYFEHKLLIVMPLKGEVPEEEYTIPLGKADIKREGKDVTVVATALMVHRALAAAAKLQEKGVSIEVIDPRTLVPLDKQTIIDSVKKTGRLVIMTEECKTGSSAAEIAAIVAEEAFDSLDAPIKRVNAPDTPVPFSPVLEKFYMPDEENLIKAVTEIV